METKRCIFVGVGGQGNLLASNLLGQAALSMGIPVVVSEIHGMAQRGGVVESAVLMGEVTSPIVSPGEADVLVSFEPLETMRILGKCNKDSLVISNAQPQPPFTCAVGQGKYPAVDEFLKKLPGKVGGGTIRDRIAEKPQGRTHAARCNPRLVHEFRIDIVPYPRKLLAKPLKLIRQDLPKGEVEAVVESHP